MNSANVEVTEVGDVVFRKGDLPAFPTEDSPVWSHRAVDSGGPMCGLMSRLGVPVKMTVKNGRWRVGRGALCKMTQSPKPAGSWHTYVPLSARGKAIRNASLQIRDDQTFVVASGDELFWSAVPAEQ